MWKVLVPRLWVRRSVLRDGTAAKARHVTPLRGVGAEQAPALPDVLSCTGQARFLVVRVGEAEAVVFVCPSLERETEALDALLRSGGAEVSERFGGAPAARHSLSLVHYHRSRHLQLQLRKDTHRPSASPNGSSLATGGPRSCSQLVVYPAQFSARPLDSSAPSTTPPPLPLRPTHNMVTLEDTVLAAPPLDTAGAPTDVMQPRGTLDDEEATTARSQRVTGSIFSEDLVHGAPYPSLEELEVGHLSSCCEPCHHVLTRASAPLSALESFCRPLNALLNGNSNADLYHPNLYRYAPRPCPPTYPPSTPYRAHLHLTHPRRNVAGPSRRRRLLHHLSSLHDHQVRRRRDSHHWVSSAKPLARDLLRRHGLRALPTSLVDLRSLSSRPCYTRRFNHPGRQLSLLLLPPPNDPPRLFLLQRPTAPLEPLASSFAIPSLSPSPLRPHAPFLPSTPTLHFSPLLRPLPTSSSRPLPSHRRRPLRSGHGGRRCHPSARLRPRVVTTTKRRATIYAVVARLRPRTPSLRRSVARPPCLPSTAQRSGMARSVDHQFPLRKITWVTEKEARAVGVFGEWDEDTTAEDRSERLLHEACRRRRATGRSWMSIPKTITNLDEASRSFVVLWSAGVNPTTCSRRNDWVVSWS